MSGEQSPRERSEELLTRVRSMVESLRERPQSPQDEALSDRISRAMQEAGEAAALAGQAGGGFLHLPATATGSEPVVEPHTPQENPVEDEERAQWEAEREQLRASVLTLQRERDDLRQHIRHLEDALALAQSEVAAAQGSGLDTPAPIREDVAFDAYDPSGHKKRMGEILVDANIISSELLDSILAEQATAKHTRIGKLLVERGITSEEMIAKVLAAQLKLPFVDLQPGDVVPAAALQVSAELARRHECIPIDGDLGRITLAMANPMDLLAIDNIELASNRRVSPVVAVPSAIMGAIAHIYGPPQK